MSCPCSLLSKHECLALNLNATFLPFVVKAISHSVLLLLASICGCTIPEALFQHDFFFPPNTSFYFIRKRENTEFKGSVIPNCKNNKKKNPSLSVSGMMVSFMFTSPGFELLTFLQPLQYNKRDFSFVVLIVLLFFLKVPYLRIRNSFSLETLATQQPVRANRHQPTQKICYNKLPEPSLQTTNLVYQPCLLNTSRLIELWPRSNTLQLCCDMCGGQHRLLSISNPPKKQKLPEMVIA